MEAVMPDYLQYILYGLGGGLLVFWAVVTVLIVRIANRNKQSLLDAWEFIREISRTNGGPHKTLKSVEEAQRAARNEVERGYHEERLEIFRRVARDAGVPIGGRTVDRYWDSTNLGSDFSGSGA